MRLMQYYNNPSRSSGSTSSSSSPQLIPEHDCNFYLKIGKLESCWINHRRHTTYAFPEPAGRRSLCPCQGRSSGCWCLIQSGQVEVDGPPSFQESALVCRPYSCSHKNIYFMQSDGLSIHLMIPITIFGHTELGIVGVFECQFMQNALTDVVKLIGSHWAPGFKLFGKRILENVMDASDFCLSVWHWPSRRSWRSASSAEISITSAPKRIRKKRKEYRLKKLQPNLWLERLLLSILERDLRFLPFFPQVKSFFYISWEFFLIRCEVKGQGCRMCIDCKALWGKFIICDIGLSTINWIKLLCSLVTAVW